MNGLGHMMLVWSKEALILFLFILVTGLWLYFAFVLWNDEIGRESKNTPLNVLKRRYSRGEITRDEFEKSKTEITKRGHHAS